MVKKGEVQNGFFFILFFVFAYPLLTSKTKCLQEILLLREGRHDVGKGLEPRKPKGAKKKRPEADFQKLAFLNWVII